jgi:hypothetical protein
MQTKLHSIVEAIASVAVGFAVSILSQLIIFPANGIHISLHENFVITCWFTIISVARSYIFRRIFNEITLRRLRKEIKENHADKLVELLHKADNR